MGAARNAVLCGFFPAGAGAAVGAGAGTGAGPASEPGSKRSGARNAAGSFARKRSGEKPSGCRSGASGSAGFGSEAMAPQSESTHAKARAEATRRRARVGLIAVSCRSSRSRPDEIFGSTSRRAHRRQTALWQRRDQHSRGQSVSYRVTFLVSLVMLSIAFHGQRSEGQRPQGQAPPTVIHRIDLVPTGSVFSADETRLEGDTYVFLILPERTLERLPRARVKKITGRTRDFAKAVVYQVDLVPAGRILGSGEPVKKGLSYVFHALKGGTFTSLKQADVKKVTRLTGLAAFRAEEEELGVVELAGEPTFRSGGPLRAPSRAPHPHPILARRRRPATGNTRESRVRPPPMRPRAGRLLGQATCRRHRNPPCLQTDAAPGNRALWRRSSRCCSRPVRWSRGRKPPPPGRPLPPGREIGADNGILSGMGDAIVTTIDSAGRVVIPKAIREEVDLEPGTSLRIEVVDGRIEIVPEPRSVRIVAKGRIRVAVPSDPSEALTDSLVGKTRESIRRERGR